MQLRRPVTLFAAAIAILGCKAKENPPAQSSAVPVVRAYVAAWNTHDSSAFDSLLATDAIHEDIAQAFVGKGPAAIKNFMKDLITVEPDYNWTLTNVFESGSHVATEWTWTATFSGDGPNGKVTNQKISGRGASVVEVDNGKIKHFTDYYDAASFFPKPAAAPKNK